MALAGGERFLQLGLDALALGARGVEQALELVDEGLRGSGVLAERPSPVLGLLQPTLELATSTAHALQLGLGLRERVAKFLELLRAGLGLLSGGEGRFEFDLRVAELLAKRLDLGLRRGRLVASPGQLSLDLGKLGGGGLTL